jgi:hypothetical protein
MNRPATDRDWEIYKQSQSEYYDEGYTSCCRESEGERSVRGHGPYPFGTVGKVRGLPALVIADCGTNCGGGDDIKVVAQYDDGYGNTNNNEWEVEWIGAWEFTPDA